MPNESSYSPSRWRPGHDVGLGDISRTDFWCNRDCHEPGRSKYPPDSGYLGRPQWFLQGGAAIYSPIRETKARGRCDARKRTTGPAMVADGNLAMGILQPL
jgi:hypothetical protein